MKSPLTSLALLVALLVPAWAQAGVDLSATSLEIGWAERQGVIRVPTFKAWDNTARFVVQNWGDEPATGFAYNIYLSADATIGASDALLVKALPVTITVPAAAGATPGTATITVEVPIPETQAKGAFYFGVVLNPSPGIAETNTANNTVVTASTVAVEVLPDLTGGSVVAPETIFIGHEVTLTFPLQNIGGYEAAGFVYRLYFSDNRVITINDRAFHTSAPMTIATGGQVDVTATAVVPADLLPGDYYVGMIANPLGDVPEANLANNIKRTVLTVSARIPAPDLTASEVRIPLRGAAGETVPVSFTLENRGIEPAGFDYGVYLSVNDTVSAEDVLLFARQRALDPGEQLTVTDFVRLAPGLPPADYYIGVVIDPDDAVFELDETNNERTSSQALEVSAPALAILTSFVPEAIVGVPFAWRFAARGGTGAYVWTIAEGALPTGLALDPSLGEISGTPTETGWSSFVLELRSGNLATSTAYTTLVTRPTVSLTVQTEMLPPALLQTRYEARLAAVGGTAPYTWTSEGRLPEGLRLDADGVLAGEPRVVGAFDVSFRVRDSRGTIMARTLAVRVVDRGMLTISTGLLPVGQTGQAYIAGFDVLGGTQPILWTLVDGELPPGLSLESLTGILSGVPERYGRFEFALQAADANGLFDTNSYSVMITAQPVLIVEKDLEDALVGEPYTRELHALPSSGQAPFTWSLESGRLPEGLLLDPVTGTIAGGAVAGTEGTYVFVVGVRDARGALGRRAFALEVIDPARLAELARQPEVEGGCASASGGAAAPLLLLALALAFVAGRRRPAMLLVLAALALPASAQAWNYSLATANETFRTITGGQALTFSDTDDSYTTVQLPFPVEFYGQQFTSLGIDTNGLLTFGGASQSYTGNRRIPDPYNPNGIVAPWWDDLDGGTTGTLSTKVEGISPTRVYIVEYKGWKRYNGGGLNFQVRFFENSRRIKFNYGAATPTGTVSGATVGLEAPDGLSGASLACSPNCSEAANWKANTSIVFSTEADLLAVQPSGPAVVYGSVPAQLNATIENEGGENAGSFKVGAYLSTNAVFDGTDRLLQGSIVVPGLAAGASVPVSFESIIPGDVPSDTNYWIFVVPNYDAAWPEAQSANNASAAIPVRTGSPSPNFRAAPPTANATSVAPAASIMVTYTLANAGNLRAEAGYRVVLSPNEIISTDDLVLTEGRVTLDGQASETRTSHVVIPATVPDGAYYLGVIMDPANEIREPDEIDNAAASATRIAVTATEVKVLTASLPAGQVGRAYEIRLQAAGGDGTYRWQMVTGPLPPGVTVSDAGLLSGVPEAHGTFPLQLLVRSAGKTALAGLTMAVAEHESPLTLLSEVLPDAIFGREYLARLVAVGGEPPYAWRVAEGALPDGMRLFGEGLLGGLPTSGGAFTFTVEVADGAGAVEQGILGLQVISPANLVVTTMRLPPSRLAEPYSFQLEAAGGTPPYRWAFEGAGRLPSGFTLDRATGIISGTPEEVGVFDLMVQVRDARETFDSNALTLSVGYDQGVSITAGVLPVATYGVDYVTTLGVVGGEGPYAWTLVGGTLPDGLVLATGGTIAGIPVGAGEERVEAFIVEVRDAAGRRDLRGLALRVAPAPLVKPSEGCSSALGGGSLAALALVLAALRRRRSLGVKNPGEGPPHSVALLGFVGLALAVALGAGCGAKSKCGGVVCSGATFCSEADGLCHCGGPSGDLCGEDESCEPLSGRCAALSTACDLVRCTDGSACDPTDGECRCGGAGGEICGADDVCDGFSGQCTAADRCGGVICASGEVCDGPTGHCLCGETACTVGQRCQERSCVEDLCHGQACAGGTQCDPADGQCKCGGADGEACSAQQTCLPGSGTCTDAPSCIGVQCRAGMSCDPSDGQCKCGGPNGEVCADDGLCDLSTLTCAGGDPCLGVTCTGGTECDTEEGVCRCGGRGGALCEAGEVCVRLDGPGDFCSAPCMPSFQDCEGALACYFSQTLNLAFCHEPGQGDEGAFCGASTECGVGLHCQIDATGPGKCRYYCDTLVGYPQAGSCPLGSYCDPIARMMDLGVCRSVR